MVSGVHAVVDTTSLTQWPYVTATGHLTTDHRRGLKTDAKIERIEEEESIVSSNQRISITSRFKRCCLTMKPRSIRCMKFFLAMLNIVFILFGLFLMAMCVIDMRERKSQPEKQSALSRGVLAFLITLALSMVVTALLGCIGALRENVKILYVHACFLIFLVSVDLVVAAGGAVLNGWVSGSSDLREHFHKNSTVDDGGPSQLMFWDSLQSANQCCGVDGPEDYALLDRKIPTSCCARAHPLRAGDARRHFHSECLNNKSYYQRGCEMILKQKLALTGKIFVTTVVHFLLLEIAAIILALWMARTVRSERRRLAETLQAHFET